MTKPTYATPAGSAFTSVAEAAWCCETIRDFVVIAPNSDRYAIRWSAIGDPTDWPTPATADARAKQAGRQEFPNKFGYVTGVAGNDFYGYVFQERAIWKMTYVGGDIVFTFDAFEEGRGCYRVNRLERIDDKVFFESEFGYHMLENDIVVDIGFGKVDRTYTPT